MTDPALDPAGSTYQAGTFSVHTTIIPLHYDGWSHYTQNEKDLAQSYQVIGIDQRLKVLEAGMPVVLDL